LPAIRTDAAFDPEPLLALLDAQPECRVIQQPQEKADPLTRVLQGFARRNNPFSGLTRLQDNIKGLSSALHQLYDWAIPLSEKCNVTAMARQRKRSASIGLCDIRDSTTKEYENVRQAFALD